MVRSSTGPKVPDAPELADMHAHYRKGGGERRKAPHVVYSEASCPHPGCDFPMRAIALPRTGGGVAAQAA